MILLNRFIFEKWHLTSFKISISSIFLSSNSSLIPWAIVFSLGFELSAQYTLINFLLKKKVYQKSKILNIGLILYGSKLILVQL